MAKQKGIIPLVGTIGGITFYKSKDGYLARERGGIPADRIANDPAFQRTRENGEEFGRAGAGGKLLRMAFRALIQNSADSRMVSRLTTEFMKVIQADATSDRGLRNVIDGETELLKGFEFNIAGKLSTTLFVQYATSINRVTGELKVTVPAFVPINMIAAPAGATHFKLSAAGASINFELGAFDADSAATGILPIGAAATAAIDLTSNVPAASTHPLFLVLGIEFYQEVNGATYILKNGAYNALSLVAVSGV